MANNRMFLMHRPTGLAAPIAKRMGLGWYARDPAAIGPAIMRLFDVLDSVHNYADAQDDFCLAMEDAGDATLADGEWVYSEWRDDGLVLLTPNAPLEPRAD